MDRKRKIMIPIAIALACVWIFFLAYAMWGIPNPPYIVTVAQTKSVSYPGFPNVTFSAVVTITTHGSLSVNNPTDVKIEITGATLDPADFIGNYTAVGFENAYPLNIVYDQRGNEIPAALYLVNYPNGTMIGSATLEWKIEGNTWILLLPNVSNITLSKSDIEQGYPLVYISSYTDTLSNSYNRNTQQLNYIIVGFSFLALLPIIDVFVPDDPQEVVIVRDERQHGTRH